MTWAWIAQTVHGEALGALTLARGRSLSFDLRGPASVKFNIDGRSAQARDLHELATDVVVWHEKERFFRGRLGSSDDDIDPDRHKVDFGAVDYRGVLAARIDETGRTYDARPQDEIGWDLVQVAQEGAGGPLGITRGELRAAAATRTEIVNPDTPIDDVLDRFQDYADGFEYWIDPGLRYQAETWRGVDHADFPLAWGSTVSKLRRTYNTGDYANWVRVRGGRPERPEGATEDLPEVSAERWAPDLATLREGRIARVVNNSELRDQGAVDAAAEQLLADSLNPPAAYSATLMPGLWHGPTDVWLGDTVPLVVRSGRLNVAATARVSQLDIDLDDDGNETVTLTVGVGA